MIQTERKKKTKSAGEGIGRAGCEEGERKEVGVRHTELFSGRIRVTKLYGNDKETSARLRS